MCCNTPISSLVSAQPLIIMKKDLWIMYMWCNQAKWVWSHHIWYTISVEWKIKHNDGCVKPVNQLLSQCITSSSIAKHPTLNIRILHSMWTSHQTSAPLLCIMFCPNIFLLLNSIKLAFDFLIILNFKRFYIYKHHVMFPFYTQPLNIISGYKLWSVLDKYCYTCLSTATLHNK